MTDHAKRLAEIEARLRNRDWTRPEANPVRWARQLADDAAVLLAQIRAASEALDALGVAPGGLAERVRALGVLSGLIMAAWVNRGAERERFLFLAASKLCDAGLLGERAAFPSGDPSPAGKALLGAVYAEHGTPGCEPAAVGEDDRLTPSERARLEAQASPATRDFLAAMREMRRTGDSAKGLEAFQAFLAETMPRAATPPPEPDLEPAVGDGPAP